MELDKRIKEGKRPLTCFDLDEAEEYIGKKCYISNEYDFFRNLDFTQQKILNGVEDCEAPFHYDSDSQAEFCLPCDWVKDSEKKYRAFTLAEWIDQHEIGEVIHCRNEHKQEFHVMYTGYVIDNGEDIQDIRTTGRIMLINMGYLLQELFERYEICINGEWQPFGVIEDE
jgi:hypothetical protein